MRDYKVEEFYNFWVTGLAGNRIFLKDDDDNAFSVPAYDFQIDWDWASSEVPVQVLSCYVKAMDQSGKPILIQNREFLLLALYPKAEKEVPEMSRFVVSQHKLLDGVLYYVLNDAYGLSHMFKPDPESIVIPAGEEIMLSVTKILKKDRNRTCLKLEDPDGMVFNADENESQEDETPIGEFGEETDTLEFKSTIVYPAGATGKDIDKQMEIITRTLAGFMNANGGVLFIGVNDNGDAVGIESEFALLNSSKTDKYSYQNNKDGYENKIRNEVNRHLNSVAQDYLHISFSEHSGHIVCKCTVEPSRTVIWFNQRDAYKRTGNRTTHLRTEAIEKLILDKVGATRPIEQIVKPVVVSNEEDILPDETVIATADVVAKVENPVKVTPKGREREGRGSFYMNMFSNGDWSWSKEMPSDDDLEFCVPINNPASKNDLIIIYEDGCVNRVDAYHLHLEKNEGKRYMNGRRNDGVKPVKAFSATNEDLLACFSTKEGHPFSKVHSVSHITSKTNMSLMGNRLVNVGGFDDVEMQDICFVSSEHAQRISALMKTENQKSTSLGFQMDLPKNQKFSIVESTLKAVCDIIAQ